jgi:hypothetical protein
MKKIISLFMRNYDGDRLVRDEVVPGAEWVQQGLGIATQKHDGTCVMVRDGKMFKRYEAQYGYPMTGGKTHRDIGAYGLPGPIPVPVRPLPEGFEPACEMDPVTQKQQGWLPVSDIDPADRWHREAVQVDGETPWDRGLADGTYELCGPKIQGNPEGLAVHMLIPHGIVALPWFPRTFDAIRAAFADPAWLGEGVVWHHSDGQMVKVKCRDFGIKRRSRKDRP